MSIRQSKLIYSFPRKVVDVVILQCCCVVANPSISLVVMSLGCSEKRVHPPSPAVCVHPLNHGKRVHVLEMVECVSHRVLVQGQPFCLAHCTISRFPDVQAADMTSSVSG